MSENDNLESKKTDKKSNLPEDSEILVVNAPPQKTDEPPRTPFRKKLHRGVLWVLLGIGVLNVVGNVITYQRTTELLREQRNERVLHREEIERLSNSFRTVIDNNTISADLSSDVIIMQASKAFENGKKALQMAKTESYEVTILRERVKLLEQYLIQSRSIEQLGEDKKRKFLLELGSTVQDVIGATLNVQRIILSKWQNNDRRKEEILI